LEKLFEACRNYPIKGTIKEVIPNKKFVLTSLTNDNMKIKMVIDNNILRSFYPILTK
jgi:hypothetical protein